MKSRNSPCDEQAYPPDFGKFEELLFRMFDDKIVDKTELDEILEVLMNCCSQAGPVTDRADPVRRAVISHGVHLMKLKLLEIHPELASAVHNLSS